MAHFTLGKEPNGPVIAGLEAKLIQQSQRVLKTEWIRVGSGELVFRASKWTAIIFVLLALYLVLVRLSIP